jgi:hypothetical protein
VLAAPVAAQTAEERLAHLISADFARASNDALLRGDRAGAIVTALRGLPDDPTDTDFATFASAHLALYRAVASRSLRWPRTGEQYYSVNRDGTRALVGDFGMATIGPVADEPYLLIDPAAGTVVAQLLSPHEVRADGAWPGTSPRFSPDGRILAVSSFRSSGVYLYDAVTGAELRRLGGLIEPLPRGRIGVDLGFSPDGQRYAALSDTRIGIWDIASGALLAAFERVRDPNIFTWPVGWGHDGQLLVQRATGPIPGTGNYTSVVLERWSVDGQVTPLLDLSGIQGVALNYALPSPWGPHVMLPIENRQVVLDLQTGRVVLDLVTDSGAYGFVRGGAAYAVLDYLAPPDTGLRVFDLATGAQVPAILADHAPFLHLLHDPGGQVIGSIGYDPHLTYRGEGLPEGRALYDFVWSALPEALHAEIAADRLARP